MHPGLTGRSSYFAWHVPLPNTWNRDEKTLNWTKKKEKKRKKKGDPICPLPSL
jgi:hypothetical protein